MNLHPLSNRWALALLALFVLAPLQSFADDEAPAPVVKAEPLQLRVVPLKHRTPEELRSLLSQFTFGEAGAPTNVMLRAAVDPRTKTLFLRGTESALKKADQLIKAIDIPADRIAKLEIEGFVLVPLKHAQPNEVSTVLQQLGVASVRPLKLGDAAVLIFAAKDESAAQLTTVIEAMDKAAAPPVAGTPVTVTSEE